MSALTISYLFLLATILFEAMATSALMASQQFTKLVPSLITVSGYIASFYCLSLALRTIPMGIAYAIWSGLGIVLITSSGYFIFKQQLDFAAIVGLGLIIAGVVIINLFSGSVS